VTSDSDSDNSQSQASASRNLTYSDDINSNGSSSNSNSNSDSNSNSESEPSISNNSDNSHLSSDQKIRNKFVTRDSAKKGRYKRSNYASGNRDQKSNDLNNFFKVQDPFSRNGTNDFTGIDEAGGNHASYVPGRQTKLSEQEKFDAAALLPDETSGQEWFQNAYSSTSVKNKHLINIFRPVGVNTIQGTLKNPSLDIRGNEICPKAVISPFLNSSYEPDNNIRGLCVSR
jgi:hypothetical protein